MLVERLHEPETAITWLEMQEARATSAHHTFPLISGRVLAGHYISVPRGTTQNVRAWWFTDVTRATRAGLRNAMLARVARLLVSFDLEAMVEAVIRAALPLLGEVGAVDWIADGPPRRLVEVALDGATPLEGPPEPAPALPPAMVARGRRARMVVPIHVEGRPAATLTFAAKPGARHGHWERELAAELADHLALAIDHCQTYRRAMGAAASAEQTVCMVAHELRTPLSALRMSVETLRRWRPGGQRGTRLLEVIARDERRVTGMIADLLDVGRIRSGQLDLELGPVDLAEVAREVIARMNADITRSGSAVTLEVEGAAVGRWDRSRLEQVVCNLLANALKFGKGRPVSIRIDGDSRCARLAVADDGAGIASGQQDRIFEPFVSTRESRRAGGLGLGLYIVRMIIRRLGGEVRVESAPEHGSIFTVELPWAGPPA
jgi:signal transduction histidine kinase